MFGKKKYSSMGSDSRFTDLAADIFKEQGINVPDLNVTDAQLESLNSKQRQKEEYAQRTKAHYENLDAQALRNKKSKISSGIADESGTRVLSTSEYEDEIGKRNKPNYDQAVIPFQAYNQPVGPAYSIVAPAPAPAAPPPTTFVAQRTGGSDITRSGGWNSGVSQARAAMPAQGFTQRQSTITSSRGKLAGVQMEKTYSDLGAALKAMEFDYDDSVTANIRRRRGGRAATIKEVGRNTSGETIFKDSTVEYYPDRTYIETETLTKQQAIDHISENGEGLIPQLSSEGANLETALNQYMSPDSIQALSTALSPTANSVTDSANALVSSVSPGVAASLKAKYDALTPGQKVAAGIGIYMGGKAAMQVIPMKYLLVAAGLYVYTQANKAKGA